MGKVFCHMKCIWKETSNSSFVAAMTNQSWTREQHRNKPSWFVSVVADQALSLGFASSQNKHVNLNGRNYCRAGR